MNKKSERKGNVIFLWQQNERKIKKDSKSPFFVLFCFFFDFFYFLFYSPTASGMCQ